MKVGVTLFAQNYTDWDRFQSGAFTRKPKVPDHQAYYEDLKIGELAEPLGFDSVWSVEHHFTPYTMVPNVLQFLTYFAAKTERVDLGTMVVVLPWHDPVQVAEQIAMLDIMLKGRKITIGFGRGAGQIEFKGLRIPMSESRGRFVESFEIVKRALSSERFFFEGQYYQIPEMSIRPQPLSKDLTERMYCAWGSPETLPLAADAGLGLLIIPQKPWEDYLPEMAQYNAIRKQKGLKSRPPIAVCWVYCDETEEKAREGAKQYMGNYGDSARRHYEFDDPEHFKAAKGYEYYAKQSEALKLNPNAFRDLFHTTQVWGTPEQCLERLRAIQKTVDASEFVGVFKYGAMPVEKAERSMRLFAEGVLPEIHKHDATKKVAAKA
ncbi:MAG: LLM class flavin-dependent oxidoreductase [Dehalococcoidia bacterium]|nr:LLM class flavin-dependent oxidoreductase [Dehalococcoidia bacterium]